MCHQGVPDPNDDALLQTSVLAPQRWRVTESVRRAAASGGRLRRPAAIGVRRAFASDSGRGG